VTLEAGAEEAEQVARAGGEAAVGTAEASAAAAAAVVLVEEGVPSAEGVGVKSARRWR